MLQSLGEKYHFASSKRKGNLQFNEQKAYCLLLERRVFHILLLIKFENMELSFIMLTQQNSFKLHEFKDYQPGGKCILKGTGTT